MIPSTNYIIFGMVDINLGFRVSKNGNNFPFIDVYNSLFCAPLSSALHSSLGSFIFSVQKSSPSKSMLFDYTITGTGPATVVASVVYPNLIKVSALHQQAITPSFGGDNFAYFGIESFLT